MLRGAIVNRYLSYKHPALKKTHRLPLIHVRFRTAKTSFTTLALIDSGATATFIPTDTAEILGLEIDQSKAESAVGAGGTFSTVNFTVTIELLKGGHSFATFENLTVVVPLNRDAIPYAVLGRDSIFMKFDVTFKELMRKTILRPAKGKHKISRYERRY